MSTSRFYKYIELYIKILPIPAIYSTLAGIDFGIEQYRHNINKKNKDDKCNLSNIDIYSNLIGYTSIGIITGITYPISFPLFGCYVLYK
jgi:hypothetical protein